jgi:hypothetical protein
VARPYAEDPVSAPDEPGVSSVGDRAVAIAGFLAILLTGFFGDDPEARPTPPPIPSAVQSTLR